MDVKARSRAMREIMTRILQRGQIEVKVFGDKVILDEGRRLFAYWILPFCSTCIENRCRELA